MRASLFDSDVSFVPIQVYEYYVGKGIYCIALRRVFNLLCVTLDRGVHVRSV